MQLKRTAFLALAALLFTASVRATEPGDDVKGPGMDMSAGMRQGGPGMERLEDQKEALGLSDAQVAKLKALRNAGKDGMKKHMDDMRDLVAKLKDQVAAKASDQDISTTLSSLKQLHKDQQAAMEQRREEAEAILTPMQQAKMFINRHEKMMQGGRRGRRGQAKE